MVAGLRFLLTLCLAVCALVGAVAVCTPAAWAQPAAAVGRISLAIGEAYRVGPDGQRTALQVGDTLHEQDRLVTGANALLMVMFVDQARLSLRADTEVLIRHYRIDASGVGTQLDMELVRGTVRQISGEAARRQPERYRLNTPIATIGVRGTDFLARASASKVETYVHEGTIVVLPPADQCRADCPVLALSSAGDARRYLQVLPSGTIERSHVPPEDVERLFGIRAATSRERESVASGRLGPPLNAAGAVSGVPVIMPLIFADPHATGSARLHESYPVASAPNAAGPGSGTVQASPPGGTQAPGTAPEVPPPALLAPPFVATDVTLVPLPTTLVWGRFSEPLQIPVTLTLSYDDARQGRHVTVGELSQYALWRSGTTGTTAPALTGQATFSLAAAQSFYRTTGGSEVATISGARLTADFGLSRFSTTLSMSTASGVSTTLSATGLINDEGLFLSLAPDGSQRVAGAFSRNGAEAGYLFNKIVGSGVFQGITLWGMKR
jgi:hypothetical protein